jgi:hypothetical protein
MIVEPALFKVVRKKHKKLTPVYGKNAVIWPLSKQQEHNFYSFMTTIQLLTSFTRWQKGTIA